MNNFSHPAQTLLQDLNGFRVEIDAAKPRADIILDCPPFNIIHMPQRDQLRLVFEALGADPSVRSDDFREGVEAFHGKRKAQFKGS